jgi:hypothetical protein
MGVKRRELAQNLPQQRALVLVLWTFRDVLPESCFIRMFTEMSSAEYAVLCTTLYCLQFSYLTEFQ